MIGWRIDIKSEEEKRAEIESQIERLQAATPLETIEDLTSNLIKKLESTGIKTVEQLADLAPEDLEAIPGIGGKTIDKIRDALSEYYASSSSYTNEMERMTQEHMFGKSDDKVSEEKDVADENQEITEHPEPKVETLTDEALEKAGKSDAS